MFMGRREELRWHYISMISFASLHMRLLGSGLYPWYLTLEESEQSTPRQLPIASRFSHYLLAKWYLKDDMVVIGKKSWWKGSKFLHIYASNPKKTERTTVLWPWQPMGPCQGAEGESFCWCRSHGLWLMLGLLQAIFHCSGPWTRTTS